MAEPFLIAQDAAPSESAIFDDARGEWVTYGNLRRTVAQRVEAMRPLQRKALLALFVSGTLDDIVWYLAAIEAGHVVILSDAGMSPERIGRLVGSYAPDWIVGRSDITTETVDYRSADLVGGWRVLVSRHAPQQAIHADQALLMSTSGTTGSQKHVCVSRTSIEHNAASIAGALGIRREDRAITTLPLHYCYGLSVVNSHLRAGASIVLNRFSVIQPQFWTLVDETRACSLAGVPFVYKMLRRLEPAQIARSPIRHLTQAGGRLSPDLVHYFHALMDSMGGRFSVMYGQTEATARMSVLQHDDLPRKTGAVGRAIPGGRFSVDTCRPSEGADSEIVYSGPNVMLGYAEQRQDLALGDRLNGVLRTGDTGHLDDEGFLYVTGRIKRIAKVAGKRINLDDIERLVTTDLPHAVIGGEDAIHIFCTDGSEHQFGALSRRVAAATGLHRSVFHFTRVDAIPRTSSGKVDYQHLSALLR